MQASAGGRKRMQPRANRTDEPKKREAKKNAAEAALRFGDILR
jgi:hypothetical protein